MTPRTNRQWPWLMIIKLKTVSWLLILKGRAHWIKCFLTLLLLRRGFLGWEKIFILVTFSQHLIILLQENRGTTLPTKVLSSQGYVFSSSHVWMWESDHKEGWVLKNWCFWTVVLEKTLESPLGCKEVKPVLPKGDQSWMFIGKTDAKAETPILRPPHAKVFEKTLMLGGVGGRRKRGRQRMRCLDGITDGHESEWTPGVGDGQGGLSCCDSWGHKESDTTERLNWLNLFPASLFVLFPSQSLSWGWKP